MKKNKSVFFLLWCVFASFHSLAQSVDWYDVNKTLLPKETFYSLSSLQADDKYLYLTTTLQNLVTWSNINVIFCKSGDTLGNLVPNINPDAYLAQYTHEGQLRWVKPMGATASLPWYIKTLSVVNKGFIYTITPNMISQDSFASPRIGSNTHWRISKIDENGNMIWEKKSNNFFDKNNIQPKSIFADANENIYLLCKSLSSRALIFDSIVPQHYHKAMLYKFDKQGRVLFGIGLPTEDIDPKDIKLDKKGNIFVLFSNGELEKSSLCRYSDWKTFILRIDAEGKNIKKIVNFVSHDLMWCNRFDILPNGDFVLVGSNKGQLTIGKFKTEPTNLIECGQNAQFMLRFSNQGELIWHNSYPLTNFSDITDIKQEVDGHLLICGISYHSNSMGYPNTTILNAPKGDQRFFIKRLTPYGQIVDSVELYTKSFRPLYYGDPQIVHANGKIFAAFEYTQRVDTLGGCAAEIQTLPSVFVARFSDRVLQKRKTTPLSNAIQIFPNPAPNGQFFVKINQKSNQAKTIRIFSLQGRLIQEKELDATILESAINLSNEAQGIYMVQVLIDDEIFIHKIFKN